MRVKEGTLSECRRSEQMSAHWGEAGARFRGVTAELRSWSRCVGTVHPAQEEWPQKLPQLESNQGLRVKMQGQDCRASFWGWWWRNLFCSELSDEDGHQALQGPDGLTGFGRDDLDGFGKSNFLGLNLRIKTFMIILLIIHFCCVLCNLDIHWNNGF